MQLVIPMRTRLAKTAGDRTKFSTSQKPSAPIMSRAPTMVAVGRRRRDGPGRRAERATVAVAAMAFRPRERSSRPVISSEDANYSPSRGRDVEARPGGWRLLIGAFQTAGLRSFRAPLFLLMPTGPT